MKGSTLFIALIAHSISATAQLTINSAFLQGRYLEAGMSNNGTFCACNDIPDNFHKNPVTNSQIGLVYDHHHDGWNAGTPPFMGDYLTFGSGYDNWSLQAGDQLYTATKSCPGSIMPSSTMTGANTAYYNNDGKMGVLWSGSAMSGMLEMKMETTLDTNASWIMITVKLRNKGTTAIPDVYYARYCEPDIDVYWPGGSGITTNEVTIQGDIRNRKLVSAYGTLDNTYLGIGSTDSRAKVLHFDYLFSSTNTRLNNIYAQTASPTKYIFTQGLRMSNNNYVGIIFKLDTIKAGDSVLFSYAYILSNTSSLDSAYTGNCTGTPLAGAISSNTDKACATTDVHLNISDYSFTSGRKFDWEESYDGNHWSAIAGVHSPTYSFSGHTVTKYFRGRVGCISGGGYSYTPAKKITYTPICPCVHLSSGVVTANTSMVSDTSILNLYYMGGSTTGITGRWQSSTDSMVWSNLAFAGASMSITGIKENTYFRYKTTCVTTGEVLYSAPYKVVYAEGSPSLTVGYTNQHTEVNLYPNPATQQLSVSATVPIHTVVVSNTVGQVLQQYSPNSMSYTIDVSTLAQGMYLIRVNDIWVSRFVKE